MQKQLSKICRFAQCQHACEFPCLILEQAYDALAARASPAPIAPEVCPWCGGSGVIRAGLHCGPCGGKGRTGVEP